MRLPGQRAGSRVLRSPWLRVLSLLAALMSLAATHGAAASPPSQDYLLNCAGCHGFQAEGLPERVPPLAHSMARFMRTATGRHYLLAVPGAANSSLSDAQLAAVLNWLAQAYDPEDLTPGVVLFTPAEVTANRRAPLVAVLAARAAAIRELAVHGPAPSLSY